MTELLEPDRITRMRSRVMTSVAEETRRRGRRTRTSLVLAGGVAAVVMVGGLGAVLGGGGSTSLDSTASDASGSSADSGGRVPAAGGGLASTDDFASQPQTGKSAPVEGTPQDADREVVVTGSASVTVLDVRVTADRLATWVEGHGGRVDSRQYDGGGRRAHASLTLRVPANQVTATLGQLEIYGHVTDTEVSKDDVTGAAKDLDARIKALRISIDRLERILDKATVTSDVIKTEGALTDRQEQLEELVSQRTQISEDVALATLDVTLSPRERAEAVHAGGFRGGLRHGWNALASLINHSVAVAGALLPWLGLLALLYGIFRVGRSVKRRWWPAA